MYTSRFSFILPAILLVKKFVHSSVINFYMYLHSGIFKDSDWRRNKFHVSMKQNEIKLHYFI